MFMFITILDFIKNTIPWNSISDIVLIIATLIPVIGAMYGLYKFITQVKNSKMVHTQSKKPDIKHFTDREEITKEIFEEIKNSEKGEIFTIYGPAGIGKTELMRVINLALNPSNYKYDKRFTNFVNRYHSYKITKNSQSYIYDCKNKSIDEVISSISSSFNLDYTNNQPFAKTITSIIRKNKHRKQITFIFENTQNNDLISAIFEIFTLLLESSNKTKYFFFIVYGNMLKPDYTNFGRVKEIEKLSIDYTTQFFLTYNLNLSNKEIHIIYELTDGNLELLRIVAQNVREKGPEELKYLAHVEDIATYFFNNLNTFEGANEVFDIFLALSISNQKINVIDVQYLVNTSVDCQVIADKLANVGFISKCSNSEYFIPKAVLQILYHHKFATIINIQRLVIRNIEKKNLILGEFEFIHKIFDNNYFTEILSVLKEKDNQKNYTLALKIYELLEYSDNIANHLIKINPNFEEILYYILEGLIGSGNYLDANIMIENYSQYFNIRNNEITTKNLKLHFLQANLYHLQNKYTESLLVFNSILDSEAVNSNIYFKAKTNWGIAHCYRHMGLLDLANNFYSETIAICMKKEKATLDVLIKCLNEQNSISMYLDSILIHSYEYIDKMVIKNEKLNSTKVAELSTNKYKAIYQVIIKNYNEALNLIERTIDIYEESNERLRFNLYYEKAEVLRKMTEFNSAIKFYRKSLQASQYNGDKNIQLYSLLGILCTELEANTFLFHEDRSQQLKSLILCDELCKDNEEICFHLGLEHVAEVKSIWDSKHSQSSFFKKNLPLF